MSNVCYNAGVLLRRLYHDDTQMVTMVRKAEEEYNFALLKEMVNDVKSMCDVILMGLDKGEARMMLEGENTEYNLGHDVKYYTEEEL